MLYEALASNDHASTQGVVLPLLGLRAKPRREKTSFLAGVRAVQLDLTAVRSKNP
jgi:hypothetical protein